MPLDRPIADRAVEQYVREQDRYVKLAIEVANVSTTLLKPRGIQAAVQYRVKTPRSFLGKLHRYIDEPNAEKIARVDSEHDAIEMVGDLAGVRIATYVEADRYRVVQLLRDKFAGPSNDGQVVVEEKDNPLGYRATHCQVMLRDDLVTSDLENVRHTSAEVQVCSMLAHVWNEIEHDMRYKIGFDWGTDEALRDSILERFRHATEDGDGDIEELLGLRGERIANGLVPRIEAELPMLPDLGPTGADVLKEFVRLGYWEVDSIVEAFLTDDFASRAVQVIERVNQVFIEQGVETNLHLSKDDADILLALLLKRHFIDLAAMYRRQLGDRTASRAALIAQAIKETQALEGD